VRPARWIPPVGAGALLAGATAYTGLLDPTTSDAFPLCPLKAGTGLDCPACGALRAVHALVHLDLAAAADHNLLLVVALPFLALGYVWWLGRSLGWRLPRVSIPRGLFPALVMAAMAFAVVRNLPIPGHGLLDSDIG
jgi:hypothetical protein